MARVRLSTTVDSELLDRARKLGEGGTDASVIEAALLALLRQHQETQIDEAYLEADERQPSSTRDAWGSLEDFLEAARTA